MAQQIDNIQAEYITSYYQEKIQQLNTAIKTCKNPGYKDQISKAIIFACKQIQRIRLAQLLAMEELKLQELN